MQVAEMKRVESSQIEAVGHDPVANTLRVAFKNGSVYTYQNVEKHTYEALLAADSIGKAFNASIKAFPSKYPYTQEV